ncbi:MAG TPA: asparagine synthase-related protein, partial [Bryobacteraceae bacterium]|nr:asparagine synthase-related protein [Bryobacteraceae bacterium]
MSLAGCAPGAHPDVISAALGALRLSPDSAVACWNDAGVALAVCGDSVLCRENHLALLLDGRIDNYPEIAAGLGREKVSGPQLLLHAYLRWGADFPRYVLGDFALALYDARDRRLLLARDAGGYRPLHYWARGEKFRFASEARGLLAAGDIPLALDERRIAHWLSMLPADPGETFFAGILSVPAGYTLVRERGHIALHRFWEPEKIPLLRLRDPREYAEGLRCVLRKAVEHRIPPSGRCGSHLSGGLDSSSITATAAQLLARRGARLTAFTAVPAVPMDDSLFPGCFCDESSHAAATVALYPDADHVLIPANAYGVFEILDGMSSAAECPQLNPWNSIWIYAICREARRRGLDVLLTGANGNFTISWDGRGALPALVADGR